MKIAAHEKPSQVMAGALVASQAQGNMEFRFPLFGLSG
jgi:hypothetical protein